MTLDFFIQTLAAIPLIAGARHHVSERNKRFLISAWNVAIRSAQRKVLTEVNHAKELSEAADSLQFRQ